MDGRGADGDRALVIRREQPREDDGRGGLDDDGNTLRAHGDHAAAHGLALQILEIDWRIGGGWWLRADGRRWEKLKC